jgi:sugar phosphate isomerase/epimerase
MHLGISSHAYGWAAGVPGYESNHPLGPLELLDRAHQLGVKVVQVADNMPLHTLSGPDLANFVTRARRLGISIELGTRGITPDAILPYIRLAEATEAQLLRTIVDTPGHQPDPNEIVRSICELVPRLEQAGVVLAVENHDRIQVEPMARIMERVGSRHVGICLDTVNSFGALEGPKAVVDALGPWTVNLHLKEFAVERFDHRMGFSIGGRPLGTGRLDVPWLLAKLGEQDRDPNAILEQWTPRESTVEATIAREAEWVRQSITYARQFIND